MSKKEGRRIKSSTPMDAMMPFIMPNRNGASNSFVSSVNIDKCEKLIRTLRDQGMHGVGMMHIFMAAYIRTIAKLPGINRYIRGQRLYARNNIEICLTIKKSLKLNAPETVVKLYATPEDTLDTVYTKLKAEIDENKQEGDNNNMDTLIRMLIKIPRIFLKGAVGFLKLLDYYGLLPRYLTKLSPFHGSMFITNLGSLGILPVTHHLYNFGNLPVFIAMGKKRTEYVLNKEGVTEPHRVIDFTVMCDERICDGHYYASAFKTLKKAIENPEELLNPPEVVVEDIK